MGILSSLIPVVGAFHRSSNRVQKNRPGICSPEANSRILNSDHYGRIYGLPRQNGRPRGVRLVSVLSELKVGETGLVDGLDLPESVQNYLMHLGFLPDAAVTVLRRAPAGDPTVYAVDGMEIALRHETASAIRVRQPQEPADGAAAPEVDQEAGLEADQDPDMPEPQSIPAATELIELVEVAQ